MMSVLVTHLIERKIYNRICKHVAIMSENGLTRTRSWDHIDIYDWIPTSSALTLNLQRAKLHTLVIEINPVYIKICVFLKLIINPFFTG